MKKPVMSGLNEVGDSGCGGLNLVTSRYPTDPSTFSEGTWTLQTYIRVSPITIPEKVLGSLGVY